MRSRMEAKEGDIDHLLTEAMTLLLTHFGQENDFALDMCSPGGIEWTNWKNGPGEEDKAYKTMSMWLESRRGKIHCVHF